MVTITREHPLRGAPLAVAGRVCRQGRLQLLLETPDGSRRFVPAEWTDAGQLEAPSAACVAPLAGLLRLRTIVDALLQRLQAAEERHDAPAPIHSQATPAAAPPGTRSPRSGLGTPRRDGAQRRAGRSGAADRTRRERERGGTGA